MTKNTVSYKWNLVKGLLTECPLDKPLEDCPAIMVRALPLKERLLAVETMAETEIDLIISHHRYCFQKRRWEELLCEKEADFTIPLPVKNSRDAMLNNGRVHLR